MDRLKLILIASFLIPCGAYTEVSSRQYHLVARSGLFHGHQMPQKTFALNATPAINNRGQISFNVISVEGRPFSGIWFGDLNSGKIVSEAPENFMASDPQINPLGQAVFDVFDEMSSQGIFAYLPQENKISQVYKPGEAFGLNLSSSSYLNSKGEVFFLGSTEERLKVLVGKVGGQFFKYAEQANGISYIFTPSFNEKAQAVSKVRLGELGEHNEGQPDEIRRWNVNGEMKVIARDRDGDPNSPYQGFANSLDFNDHGDVFFRAAMVGGGSGRFLYSADSEKTSTVAMAPKAEIAEIEYFTAKLNNSGQVVFRAKNKRGLRGIYLFTNAGIEMLMQEGDSLPSDIGPVKIYFAEDHPGFGGSPGLNDHGHVVVLVSTVDPAHHDQTYSKAVYLIK
mgnify:FL=1